MIKKGFCAQTQEYRVQIAFSNSLMKYAFIKFRTNFGSADFEIILIGFHANCLQIENEFEGFLRTTLSALGIGRFPPPLSPHSSIINL